MKLRDKIKYGFATFLALATCSAIVALKVAQNRRDRISEAERTQIRATLETFGQPDRRPTAQSPQMEKPAPPAARGPASQLPPPNMAPHSTQPSS